MLVDRYGTSLYDFDVIQAGQLTVHKTEGNTMIATATLQKQCKGTPIVLANVYNVSGTPYTQPINIVGKVDGNILTLNAYGISFVQNHLLDIRYIVLDKHKDTI